MKKILFILSILMFIGAILTWRQNPVISSTYNIPATININSTGINNGAGNTKALYDNAGVVGEKDMLPLSGGTMTGNILVPNGSGCTSLPYSFSGNSGTGFYRIPVPSETIGICINSNIIYEVRVDGWTTNPPLNMGLGRNLSGSAGNGFGRIFLNSGTSLATTDWGSISAGCGSTASVSAVSGDDSRGTVTLASAGTGQSSNGCSFTLTFHDGTFTNSPFTIAGIGGTLPTTPLSCAVTAENATTVTFTLVGTPVATTSYTCNFITIG